ncbi:acyl-CoA thioesterase FadM [Chitinivorax tropicus]|uniref:Acyl-CoA thioesterase FadM n=1 Tax=Chitinivorax tropicus TaxID=714531 RepID=A0A840MP48_9PROT|nr:thioesterase family protein [Chitinivorax tropicus]MBB5019235.1 acyl-CoA thioesterase FadM [Chitinivorax tropicus]
MNLYFRFLITLIRTLLAKPTHALALSRQRFRCMPWDCDINMHMTNSRYLSFMDLGRTYLLGTTGILGTLLRHKWGPVVQAADLTFIREIKPFQSFELVTRLLCWDEKYWYIQQDFEVDGKVCASAVLRGLFVKGREKVSSATVLGSIGFDEPSPIVPAHVEAWAAAFQLKKNATR